MDKNKKSVKKEKIEKKEESKEKKVSEWMGVVGFILGVSVILLIIGSIIFSVFMGILYGILYITGLDIPPILWLIFAIVLGLALGIIFLVLGLRKEKKMNFMSILGISILVAVLYLLSGYLIPLLAELFILLAPILGLIFSIIQLKRKKTKFAIAGLIICIIEIILYILGFLLIISTADFYPIDDECTQVKLTLLHANSLDNTLEIRRNAGGADVNVTSVKIILAPLEAEREIAATITNPPEGQRSIGELETITYTVSDDIKAGDTVNIAAIALHENGINLVCDRASSIKAI